MTEVVTYTLRSVCFMCVCVCVSLVQTLKKRG